MDDKHLVKSFLDSNYTLKPNYSKFDIIDNETKKEINKKYIESDLLIVFGKVNNLKDYVDEWIEYRKSMIFENIYAVFETLDLNNRSINLVSEFLEPLEGFDRYFIVEIFEDYYYNNVIKNKVKKIIETKCALKKLTSLDLIRSCSDVFEGETLTIVKNTENFINEWYFDKIFSKIIENFFEECQLILGKNNWVANHKKFGEFNKKHLKNLFPNETDFQMTIFNRYYDDWYNKNVLLVSEKMTQNF